MKSQQPILSLVLSVLTSLLWSHEASSHGAHEPIVRVAVFASDPQGSGIALVRTDVILVNEHGTFTQNTGADHVAVFRNVHQGNFELTVRRAGIVGSMLCSPSQANGAITTGGDYSYPITMRMDCETVRLNLNNGKSLSLRRSDRDLSRPLRRP